MTLVARNCKVLQSEHNSRANIRKLEAPFFEQYFRIQHFYLGERAGFPLYLVCLQALTSQ